MKFTFNWLKDHLETDRPLSDIVDKLSMIGLEVEGVDDRAQCGLLGRGLLRAHAAQPRDDLVHLPVPGDSGWGQGWGQRV